MTPGLVCVVNKNLHSHSFSLNKYIESLASAAKPDVKAALLGLQAVLESFSEKSLADYALKAVE